MIRPIRGALTSLALRLLKRGPRVDVLWSYAVAYGQDVRPQTRGLSSCQCIRSRTWMAIE
jgi:hypothetical protein